jgi:hypothetical protein
MSRQQHGVAVVVNLAVNPHLEIRASQQPVT